MQEFQRGNKFERQSRIHLRLTSSLNVLEITPPDEHELLRVGQEAVREGVLAHLLFIVHISPPDYVLLSFSSFQFVLQVSTLTRIPSCFYFISSFFFATEHQFIFFFFIFFVQTVVNHIVKGVTN